MVLEVLGGAGGAWWCMAVQHVWFVPLGAAWRCLVVPGGAWWCLVLLCAGSCCLALLGAAWRCLMVIGGAWLCLVVPCGRPCCLVLLGAAWRCFVVHGGAVCVVFAVWCCLALFSGAWWCFVVVRSASWYTPTGHHHIYPIALED
jgi:hypothetical protein